MKWKTTISFSAWLIFFEFLSQIPRPRFSLVRASSFSICDKQTMSFFLARLRSLVRTGPSRTSFRRWSRWPTTRTISTGWPASSASTWVQDKSFCRSRSAPALSTLGRLFKGENYLGLSWESLRLGLSQISFLSKFLLGSSQARLSAHKFQICIKLQSNFGLSNFPKQHVVVPESQTSYWKEQFLAQETAEQWRFPNPKNWPSAP